ncbi:MAG: hypothetical protein ACKOGL_03640, partial [Acidimicrobiaceae bacterium]
PADLKASVGAPTLIINTNIDQTEKAKSVLSTFGDLRPGAEGALGVGLRGGASQVTEVVRKLDEAGVHVQHLEINEPSLDDVLAEATGYSLEGSDNAPTAGDNGDEEPKKKKRRGRK